MIKMRRGGTLDLEIHAAHRLYEAAMIVLSIPACWPDQATDMAIQWLKEETLGDEDDTETFEMIKLIRMISDYEKQDRRVSRSHQNYVEE